MGDWGRDGRGGEGGAVTAVLLGPDGGPREAVGVSSHRWFGSGGMKCLSSQQAEIEENTFLFTKLHCMVL